MAQKKRRGVQGVPQKRLPRKKQTKWQALKYSLTTIFIFVLTGFAIWLLLLMLQRFIGFNLWNWFESLPIIYPIASYILSQIAQKSFEGIVYAFMFSSLFFIPSPLEVIFLGFLTSVRGTMSVIVPTFIGLVIGQHINYWSGKIFGRLIKGYIKKSTRHKVQDRLRAYGAQTIFFINLLPLPYPITNFLAGSLKYPYKKWALFASLGLAIKLVFIAWLINLIF